MDSIIVEGVRCFYDRQVVPIKPITLLVGENSTGKTTFLALTRIAWDIFQGRDVDFNEEPFLLGAYDQIATYRAGKAGYAKNFVIGVRQQVTPDVAQIFIVGPIKEVTATGRFIRKAAQPYLQEWILDGGEFRTEIRTEDDGQSFLTLIAPSGSAVIEIPPSFRIPLPLHPMNMRTVIYALMDVSVQTELLIRGTMPSDSDLRILGSLATFYEWPFSDRVRPYAFAPIRTRPRRTYDPIKDVPTPEGSHIPMVLAQASLSDLEAWHHLKDYLGAFGKESGLFSEVEVKRLGHKASDPFQIKVKLAGPAFNLMDVGYGVSQALPIVVDSLRAEPGSTLLLQQPEVHLHPKAQAELGSFLALLAKQQNKQFLIETHSDHLMDRIRMEVRDKRVITENDVSFLYFERENGGVKIHTLELDAYGNIMGQPAGYRQFFLEEEKRLLGI